MFTHLMLGSNDKAKAEAFYDAALAPLGIHNIGKPRGMVMYGKKGAPALVIMTPRDGQPACVGNGSMLSFAAPDAAAVDAFHAGGLANGGTDEGAPGVRDGAPGKPYGAYLRDPDGNKIAAFTPMSG